MPTQKSQTSQLLFGICSLFPVIRTDHTARRTIRVRCVSNICWHFAREMEHQPAAINVNSFARACSIHNLCLSSVEMHANISQRLTRCVFLPRAQALHILHNRTFCCILLPLCVLCFTACRYRTTFNFSLKCRLNYKVFAAFRSPTIFVVGMLGVLVCIKVTIIKLFR